MHAHSSDTTGAESTTRQAARNAETSLGESEQADAAPIGAPNLAPGSATVANPRLLSRRTLQRLQSTAGNQALLGLWGRDTPRQQPVQPTIQRQLSDSDWHKFVARYVWNVTVAQWAANLGNNWDHALNILNLGVHIAAQSQDDLAQFIAAGGPGTGPYVGLTSLSTAAKSRGTVPELTALLTAAGAPNANLGDATNLVSALPDGATLVQTTGLVSAALAAKGSVRDATALLKVLPSGATVADAATLFRAIATVGAKPSEAAAFVIGLPKSATLSDAVELVTEVGAANGTLAQATKFMAAAKTHGSLAEAKKLITTAKGSYRNVATLTALVTDSPTTVSMTELTEFLAAAQLSKGDANQMSLLLTEAVKAGMTIKQVTALMPACQAIAGSIAELKGLLAGLPKPFTVDDAKGLLEAAEPPRGTVVQLGDLTKTAPKGTTLKQLAKFLEAFHTAGGTVLESIAFVKAVAKSAPFDEQIALFTGQPKVQAADAIDFVKLSLKPATIKTITDCLQGVKHADALALTAALRADGLADPDLVGILQRLSNEGKKGPEVLAAFTKMRGTLDAKATSNLGAMSPQGATGTLVLSGPQITSHLKGLPTPKQNAVGYESQYPTGKNYANLDVDTLFTHLDRAALSELKGNSMSGESPDQIAARRALALAQLKMKTNAAWVDAVFNLYEYSGKQFALPALRDAVKPLCPALTALQVTTMVRWLDPLTGDEVLELLRALNDGLAGPQIDGLLAALHAAPVSYTGTQIRDLVKRLRGNLAVVGAAEPKQLRSILTQLTTNKDGTKNPDTAGERLLTSAELYAHLTTNVAGVANNQPVPALGNLYPTGQDYTVRTKDQLWLDCGPGVIHQDTRTNQPETLAQVEMRRKLALNRLKTGFGYSSRLVQAVFNYNDGQTPRAFVSAAIEDGYGLGGHTVDSHVLDGSGRIKNTTDLAIRVCTKDPVCPERAGAYKSLTEANHAIGAVNAVMSGAWTGDNGYRDKICSGLLAPFVLPNTSGYLFEKADEPKTDPYSSSEMKKRGYFGSTTVKNPLVISLSPITVRISADTHSSAPGGWFVVTAFPTLGD